VSDGWTLRLGTVSRLSDWLRTLSRLRLWLSSDDLNADLIYLDSAMAMSLRRGGTGDAFPRDTRVPSSSLSSISDPSRAITTQQDQSKSKSKSAFHFALLCVEPDIDIRGLSAEVLLGFAAEGARTWQSLGCSPGCVPFLSLALSLPLPHAFFSSRENNFLDWFAVLICSFNPQD